jgi:hypothetical protein
MFLLLASCAGDSGLDEPPGGPEKPMVESAPEARARVANAPEECNVVPEPGPCEVACDQQQLFDLYIEPGLCVTFVCEDISGEPALVGGCNV